MKNLPAIIVIVFMSIVLLNACATPAKPASDFNQIKGADNAKPSWVWKPGLDGKIGGVGVCGQHVNGLSGQRDLAVQRAIDNIAQQMGVTVKNAVNMISSGTKDSAETRMEVYSIHTVDGAVVKAAVKEWWEDQITGELYVWMVVL